MLAADTGKRRRNWKVSHLFFQSLSTQTAWSFLFFLTFYFYFILLYNTVLVLPYIGSSCNFSISSSSVREIMLICLSWFLLLLLPFHVFVPDVSFRNCCCCLVAQSCLTLLWPPPKCRLLGSSVHGILQARMLEWVASSSSSKGSSHPRDWTRIACIAGGFLTAEPPGKLNKWITQPNTGKLPRKKTCWKSSWWGSEKRTGHSDGKNFGYSNN